MHSVVVSALSLTFALFTSGDVDPSVTLGETDGSESGTRALSPVHHELESALAPEDISQEEDNTDVDDEVRGMSEPGSCHLELGACMWATEISKRVIVQ